MVPLAFIASSAITFFGLKLLRHVKKAKPTVLLQQNSEEKSLFFANDWEEKTAVYQAWIIASSSLLFAILGVLFYPSSLFISVLGITYNLVSLWQNVFKLLFQEHRINANIIDAMTVSGLLITRHYLLAALIDWIFYSLRRLAFKIRTNFQESLLSLFGIIPNSVWLWQNEVEIEVPLEEAQAGDIVVMHAGDIIPVDGTIVEGTVFVNQAIFTQDSQPIEKGIGDQLIAFTEITAGKVLVKLSKPGQETIAAKINKITAQITEFKTKAAYYSKASIK